MRSKNKTKQNKKQTNQTKTKQKTKIKTVNKKKTPKKTNQKKKQKQKQKQKQKKQNKTKTKTKQNKKKQKSSPHFVTFPPSNFNFKLSFLQFSFFSPQFSSLFPFFLTSFFPVGQQKFPGQKCTYPTPRMLRHWSVICRYYVSPPLRHCYLKSTREWMAAYPCSRKFLLEVAFLCLMRIS